MEMNFVFLQSFSDLTILLTHPENLRDGKRKNKSDWQGCAGIEGKIYRIKGHKRSGTLG
jgi:hypothetical protein